MFLFLALYGPSLAVDPSRKSVGGGINKLTSASPQVLGIIPRCSALRIHAARWLTLRHLNIFSHRRDKGAWNNIPRDYG